jgi:hypothetical protein
MVDFRRRRRRNHMFAVIGNAQIDPDRVEEAVSILEERLLPRVKAMGGFVSATWTRSLDDKNGTSMVLFETEAAANAAVEAAKEMAPPPEAPLTFVDFRVVRVVAQA